jgi:hypothetical protein
MSLDTETPPKMNEEVPSLPPKKRLSSRTCHDDAPAPSAAAPSAAATSSESVSKKQRLTNENKERCPEAMKQYENNLIISRPIHAFATYGNGTLKVSATITLTRRLGFFFVNISLNGVPTARVHLEYRPDVMKRLRENFILIDVFQTAGCLTRILKSECDLTSSGKKAVLTLRCNNSDAKFELFIDMENVVGYIRESKRLLMGCLLSMVRMYSCLEAPTDAATANVRKTMSVMERVSMTQF